MLRCLDSVARQRHRPQEVIVLDDASDQLRVADIVAGHRTEARVIRSEVQLGVGRGRNRLLADASGDAFVVLDDDAVLEDPDFLGKVVVALTERPRAAILAARILDHQGDGTRLLVPFSTRARTRDPALTERAELVSYFLGGAHVIRRDAYRRVGGYDESFVWGEEELDLSFRVVNAGFEIHYVPALEVHHRAESPVLVSAGQDRRELQYHVRNRLILARKYLPMGYALPYLVVWLVRHAMDAIRTRDPVSLAKGVREGLVAPVRRERLTAAALEYLGSNHGRLRY